MTPARLALASRTAALVVAAGTLWGVSGSVVTLVAAAGLATFGRAVAGGGLERTFVLGSIFAAALVPAALRWGEARPRDLRGIQAVLGPTVAVGPPEVAIATAVSGAVAVLAFGAWLGRPDVRGLRLTPWDGALWTGEAVVGGVAIAGAYWAMPLGPGSFGGQGLQVVAGGLVTAALAALVGWWSSDAPSPVVVAVAAAAAAALVAAGAVVVAA